MQTGSGVSHEEETVAAHNEFFQIWFQPDMKKAIGQTPTYHEFLNEDFTTEIRDGVTVKHVIGHGAPVSIQTDAIMQDILIPPNHYYQHDVPENHNPAASIDALFTKVEDTLKKQYLAAGTSARAQAEIDKALQAAQDETKQLQSDK